MINSLGDCRCFDVKLVHSRCHVIGLETALLIRTFSVIVSNSLTGVTVKWSRVRFALEVIHDISRIGTHSSQVIFARPELNRVVHRSFVEPSRVRYDVVRGPSATPKRTSISTLAHRSHSLFIPLGRHFLLSVLASSGLSLTQREFSRLLILDFSKINLSTRSTRTISVHPRNLQCLPSYHQL